MYTYNLFIFGHNMSVNKKLNEFIGDMDIVLSKRIGNNKYECDLEYHGGSFDYQILFGVNITDDDQNPNFINKVRDAKSSTYIDEYNIFLSDYIEELLLATELGEFDEDRDTVNELVSFLNTEKPDFYTLQVSS